MNDKLSPTFSRKFSDVGKQTKPENEKAALPTTDQRDSHSATHVVRYVRLPELRKMIPWSPATIWRQSRNPNSRFPKPIKLSARVTAWNVAAVEAFLAEKEAA